MDTHQYMKVPVRFFTSETKKEYDITRLAHNGFEHVETQKGTYGLKEAGITVFRRLVKNISPHGYHLVKYTPGL